MANKAETKSFELAGKKLGLLLSAAPLPLKIRQAWADLLPFMDIAQMAELSRQLELLVIGRPTELEMELINLQIKSKSKKPVKKIATKLKKKTKSKK